MIVFTSICSNYGHKARILAESVHKYIPDAQFFLCLTEREIPRALAEDRCFDRIVLSEDVWEGNFRRFIFKHSIVEASTAVKGRFFQWLQNSFPEENSFVYLDPDCRVYSDFTEIRQLLQEAPAVLCPHLLHPGNIDMELSSTAHGVYNLGFLAVNNSEEARRLIDWWTERLYLYCYDDIPNGIFTDQKWMELAPCFFDVRILRHYGYDMAPWGLKDTRIRKERTGWQAEGQPLRFIHYSGFGPVAEMCMEKWLDAENQGFRTLYDEYAKAHAAADADRISETPWSYDTYVSGEKILQEVREGYRKNWDIMFGEEDPFERSNRYFEALIKGRKKSGSPEENGFGKFRRKLSAARRIQQEQGVSGVLKKIAGKVRGRME